MRNGILLLVQFSTIYEHTITDVTSLTSAQQYWLSQLPNLNTAIPSEAHPDLPKFNPPFNEQQMQQYQDKCNQKTPRTSAKLQDKINECIGALADNTIINLHANPVGVASYVVLVPKPDGNLRISDECFTELCFLTLKSRVVSIGLRLQHFQMSLGSLQQAPWSVAGGLQ
jgi:hypothetical protein